MRSAKPVKRVLLGLLVLCILLAESHARRRAVFPLGSHRRCTRCQTAATSPFPLPPAAASTCTA